MNGKLLEHQRHRQHWNESYWEGADQKINTIDLDWSLRLPTGTSQMPPVEKFDGQTSQKNWASGHNDMRYVWRYKGEVFKFKNTTATVQHDGGSVVLRGCFAASGTGALHKVDGAVKKEDYFQILQLHLTSTVRRLEHIET